MDTRGRANRDARRAERAGTLAALGNSIFGFFKGGSFGGHVAANVTVALGPRLRDAINSYMQHSFGDYSKQVNQDTKKLQDSNAQLQKDLTKGQGSQNQQDIKNLGNQIGTESGQLQKDISPYQKSTAQGVYDILNKYGQQPQKKSQQAPAPGLPPAKQNDPASGTRPPFKPPARARPARRPTLAGRATPQARVPRRSGGRRRRFHWGGRRRRRLRGGGVARRGHRGPVGRLSGHLASRAVVDHGRRHDDRRLCRVLSSAARSRACLAPSQDRPPPRQASPPRPAPGSTRTSTPTAR